MYPELAIDAFLQKLASSAPEPGGGAAAALVGAAGAALVGMVANLTVGREKFAAAQAEMERARERADALRAALLAAIDRDAEAFRAVMAAYRMPRETEAQRAARRQATQDALRAASRVPADVVALCEDVAGWSRVAAERGNPQVISDAAVAALLADAAAQSAALNVRINVAGITDAAFTGPLWAEVAARLDRIRALRDEVVTLTYERIG
jgi:formiminotetrahydrofolate cyclodeaminase